MKARRGTLRAIADDRLPLQIKRQPTVFDGVFYEVGFMTLGGDKWFGLKQFSRERDARRALRAIGYVQEGNRWVASESIAARTEVEHAD